MLPPDGDTRLKLVPLAKHHWVCPLRQSHGPTCLDRREVHRVSVNIVALVRCAQLYANLSTGSDPRAGTPPSLIDHNSILRSVSLSYLTKTFVSAAYTYAQNLDGFRTEYVKPPTDAPFLFSAFKYNLAFWPPALVAQASNLVQYRSMKPIFPSA